MGKFATRSASTVRRSGEIISALPEIITEETRLYRVEALLLLVINEMSFLCDGLIKEYIYRRAPSRLSRVD